ncbi:MAG: GDP-mannose 4,6-dehydratase [Candidatus Margulisiibacteriota bacterium]
MTVLVTGGAGFIGSSLVDRLLALGHHVVVLDNLNDYYSPAIKRANLSQANQHPNFTFYEGDILDDTLLHRIFKNHTTEILIHLAARAGVRESLKQADLYTQVNVIGTAKLLDCAKNYGVKKVLNASSSSVYGNNPKVPFSESDPVDTPISPYAATKKSAELLAHVYHATHGLAIANLRFFTVYGPRQRPEMAIHYFTQLIDQGKVIPVYNKGLCFRDYTYIDDIVQGILQVMDHPTIGYDIVNLGGAKTISTLELIALIELNLGKKAIIDLLPSQSGDVDRTFADVAHAQTKYGYIPTVEIAEGISRFVAWYRHSF